MTWREIRELYFWAGMLGLLVGFMTGVQLNDELEDRLRNLKHAVVKWEGK